MYLEKYLIFVYDSLHLINKYNKIVAHKQVIIITYLQTQLTLKQSNTITVVTPTINLI